MGPPLDAPEQPWPPSRRVAGRYTITRPIGRGGMGLVYAAVDPAGRPVALKIPFAAAVADARARRRFLREVRTALTLEHPNIVRVLAVDEEAGRPVMVMELLRGRSLTDWIRERGRLSLGETARIMVPVLGALAAAHARGIVHRDVKPDNIFLAESGDEVVPKVLDFGVAKLLPTAASPESLRLTNTGAMLGTPYYMAPEQAAARPAFDHRVDLWAVGVVLYETLAGRRPFDGQVYGQIFAAIFGEEPPPLDELAPELPAAVVELVGRCLRKRPEERPAAAGEIAEALLGYTSLPAASYPRPGNTLQRPPSGDALEERREAAGPALGFSSTLDGGAWRGDGAAAAAGTTDRLGATGGPQGRWLRAGLAVGGALLALVAGRFLLQGSEAALSIAAPSSSPAPALAGPGSMAAQSSPPAPVRTLEAPPAPVSDGGVPLKAPRRPLPGRPRPRTSPAPASVVARPPTLPAPSGIIDTL